MNNYCLYHASCPDGFGAAFAVWLKYREEFEYIPVQYNESVPELDKPDTIMIVDFSYPKEILERLQDDCNFLIVIDHHKTAEAALKDWEPTNGVKIFDMEHSGAVLTYSYLNPEKEVPEFFRYIEDRDLWKWKMPNSREFSAGLALEEFDFNKWNDAFIFEGVDTFINEGYTILKYINKTVKSLAEKAVVITNDDGNKVATVNSCLYQSELGEYLNQNLEIDYADIYFIKHEENAPGKIIHSLRSKSFDVSEVAKSKGGGGHRLAAGYMEIL